MTTFFTLGVIGIVILAIPGLVSFIRKNVHKKDRPPKKHWSDRDDIWPWETEEDRIAKEKKNSRWH